MNEAKKIYYKLVCDEFPGGLLYEEEDNSDALRASKELRETDGERAYIRKVTLTKAELENYPEV